VVIGAFHAAMVDEARSRGYTAVRIPRGINLPGGMRAIARVCREHAIDLVNAHSLRMTFVAGMARKLRLMQTPLVTTIHNVADRKNDQRARKILERFPDEVIFISRYERERLAELWGHAVGQVIYSGVELPRPGATDAIDLEAKHAVPRDARVIGFVGRLSPEKAVGDAITALVRLPDDVWLCVVGDGADVGALRAEARRRGVERRVVFAGYSREVDRYMVSFSALVLPSRREALPVTLREAGALSIPVIAADVGGVREVVVPRETGLLYPTGDVDALVRAIRSMLEDPSRAAAMGCAARQRVAQIFGVKRWVDETEALFAQTARTD
jgi:glycosyltransferase involved in cell wall biosynthesis